MTTVFLLLLMLPLLTAILFLAAFCFVFAWLRWRHHRELHQRYRRPAANVAAARPAQLRWIGPAQLIEVGGVQLRGPSSYVTDSRAGPSPDPQAIDLALPTAQRASEAGFYQRVQALEYAELSPGQRRAYLDWLAHGRKQPPAYVQYSLLFVAGLERRVLIDGRDHLQIFSEVLRLRELYADHDGLVERKFLDITGAFLRFIALQATRCVPIELVRQLTAQSPGFTAVQRDFLFGWFAAAGVALTDWAAFPIAGALPRSRTTVVASRDRDELRMLFCRRYRELFSDGLRATAGEQSVDLDYHTINQSLPEMASRVPAAKDLEQQLQPLSDLWNRCADDLRKYSIAVSKGDGVRLTSETWELMPPDLRSAVEHPQGARLRELFGLHETDDGYAVVSVSQLASALEMDVRTAQAGSRLTPVIARKLCVTAGYIGYCLEPDARAIGGGYKGDEKVAVFLRESDAGTNMDRYNAAACMLRVGMAIVLDDGKVREAERDLLMREVRSAFQLDAQEQRRLDALAKLLADSGTDMSTVRSLAKKLSAAQREAVAKLAIALVAADGAIMRQEMRALRACYAGLGLDKQKIDAELRLLLPRGDEPVTVRQGSTVRSGEAIPTPDHGLKLNREAIDAILRDTREVATMLASAMGEDAGDDDDDATAESDQSAQPRNVTAAEPSGAKSVGVIGHEQTPGEEITPPARYASLYRDLLGKDVWTAADADALARRHGLMLSGAMEALNEWAVEALGGQLFIEEDGRIVVERDLIH